MNYTEFKRYCSIFVGWDGKQTIGFTLPEEIRSIAYFINFLIFEPAQASELLSLIDTLQPEGEETVLIPKSEYDHWYALDKDQNKMATLYDRMEKNEQGDLLVKKEDIFFQVAHCFGVIGFLMILPPPRREFSSFMGLEYGDTYIKLDTQMNQYLVIKKDKTAVIGWEKFPEILFFETALVYELIDHWRRFLLEYESGEIPYIIPPNKQEEWVIVPKEFVKDEYWEMKKT